MTLGIAICTRERPEELAGCLASIEGSELADQIIVSTDGLDRATDDVVRSFAGRLPELTFVRGPRAGLAANRNECVRACRTDYLLFLDDDARLSPNFLARALPRLSPDRLVTGWERRAGTKVTACDANFLGFQRRPPGRVQRSIVINATVFPTPFLRTRPFDEFFRFGLEELDIAHAAVGAGLSIVTVDAGNEHRHVPTSRAGNDRAALRSRIYFSVKRYRSTERDVARLALFVLVAPLHATLHALRSSGARGAVAAIGDVATALLASLTDRRRAVAPATAGDRPFVEPSVSVVVPTFRRPVQLRLALCALTEQSHPPDEIVVSRRVEDVAARGIVSEFGGAVREVVVDAPGQVAALRAGAERATSDVIAFIDDDTIPRHDWLERLVAHYRDPGVVGVGGRDVVHQPDGTIVTGSAREVGRIRFIGRRTGNHHLGAGHPRVVDVLKGCNCSYRREALGIPVGLRGDGAEVANDLAMSLASGRSGHLVYDPTVLVDHHPGRRRGEDRREQRILGAILDAVYNETYVLCSTRPSLHRRRVAYCLLVGDSLTPGLLRSALARARREDATSGRFYATARTVLSAASDARRSPLRFTPVAPRGDRAANQSPEPGSTDTGRRRPTVALVAHEVHDRGGMERACAELIRHAHHDVRFVVVTTELAPDLRPLVAKWEKIAVPRRPFALRFVSFFVRAAFVLRHVDADLVQTVGAIVPTRVDVATVHFCHAGYRAATGSLAPGDAPWLRRLNTSGARTLALLAERWCYRPSRARVLAAVSEGVRREVETFYSRVPTTVTPNGVDVACFRPSPDEHDAFRRATGTDPSACVALFVGGEWDRKGLALAIEAAAKARSDGAHVVLWVVGPGDESRFAERARELGVADGVTFFGRRNDTERFYQAADLFVLPTAYEAFPLVSLEAAACGLPLVIPAVSGAAELVGDDRAGTIVDRDATSVAAAVATLTNDPERRAVLGAEARRRSKTFTWSTAAASTVSLYDSLLAEPRS